MRKSFILALLFVAGTTSVKAEVAMIAVAANFSSPMQKIATSFQKDSGHKLSLSFGSSGAFYAQIKNGGPFDVFLSADSASPQKLEQEGLGVSNSRFNYAKGQLVLWSPKEGLVDQNGQVLRSKEIQRIAIANPKLSPYGAASIEALMQLGLMTDLQAKLVHGDNIAQTYQFVMTQNAQMGFVALSQVFANGKFISGSAWTVPSNLYRPIQQDAILLKNGKDNPAAKAFMLYLQSDNAKDVMKSYGYLTD